MSLDLEVAPAPTVDGLDDGHMVCCQITVVGVPTIALCGAPSQGWDGDHTDDPACRACAAANDAYFCPLTPSGLCESSDE